MGALGDIFGGALAQRRFAVRALFAATGEWVAERAGR